MSDISNSGQFDWGGVLQAGADIAVAGINAGSTKASQKRAFKFNKQLMEHQDLINDQNALDSYNRAIEAWHMTNEYNDPSAARRRYEDAGMNPALAYGGGSAGVNTAGGLSPAPASEVGVGSIGTPALSVTSPNMLALSEALVNRSIANKNNAEADSLRGDTKPQQANIAATEARAALDRAMTDKAVSENERTKVLTALDEFNLSLQIETRDLTIDTARANLYTIKQNYRKLAADIEGINIDNSIKRESMRGVIIDMILKEAELNYYLETGQTATTAMIDEARASAVELDEQALLNAANRGVAEQEAETRKWGNVASIAGSIALTIASLWGVGKAAKGAWSWYRRKPAGFK